MARTVTLEKAVEAIPGITRHELYTGLRSGKYPGFRVGGIRGKWIIDLDMLELRIRELMTKNIRDEIDNKIGQCGQIRKISG